MPYVRRQLGSALAAASAVCTVVLLGLWCRSYWAVDAVNFTAAPALTPATVYLSFHNVSVGHGAIVYSATGGHNPTIHPLVGRAVPAVPAGHRPGWTYAAHGPVGVYPTLPPAPGPRAGSGATVRATTYFDFAGIAAGRRIQTPPKPLGPVSATYLIVPLWLPTLLSLLPAAAWWRRRRLATRRGFDVGPVTTSPPAVGCAKPGTPAQL